MHSISISPKQVVITLISVIPLMLALQFSLRVIRWVVEQNADPRSSTLYALVQRLHFDSELSVPTWYSATLLLIGAALFALIAATKSRFQKNEVLHWQGLAILLFYLSIDEASSLHELTVVPLRTTFNLSGVLYFSWVVIALPALLVLFFIYLKFFKTLPQQTRRLLLLAIGLYVGGGLGIELIGAHLVQLQSFNRVAYFAVSTAEEVLEMLGVNVLIYALLTYIAREIGSIELSIRHSVSKRDPFA
ncbi:hypothetical protein ACQ4M3_33815 [Leptolyngbya sp. AN03gr2]|uniref:hypothetical protein n=1 Tax=unclassified Leptolyngbya TaxID=2650499 RepID=UPI003D313C98